MASVYHWSVSEKCEALTTEVFPHHLEPALDGLPRDYFERYSPDRNWRNEYDIVYIRSFPFTRRLPKRQVYYGDFSISKSDAGVRGGACLSVVQTIHTPQAGDRNRLRTELELGISQDDVSSLTPDAVWHLKNTVFDDETGSRIDRYSTLEEWGRLTAKGVVESSDDGVDFRPRIHCNTGTSAPISSNWGIIDAVGRLARQEKRNELGFGMLQNLDLYKPNQRLVFLERFEFAIAEKRIPLNGYCQIGEGILPSYYWVTDSGLLLLARFGLMAYVYKAGGNTQ